MTTESLVAGGAREFTTRSMSWRSFVPAGCLGICGLLLALGGLAGAIGGGWELPAVGLFFFLIGIALPIVIFFFRKTHAIACRANGFTVRTIRGRIAAPEQRDYRWQDVTATNYREVRGKAGTRTRKMRFVVFSVETTQGEAFAIDEQLGDWLDLVRLFNVMTPHLPYTWEPAATADAAAYFVQMPRVPSAPSSSPPALPEAAPIPPPVPNAMPPPLPAQPPILSAPPASPPIPSPMMPNQVPSVPSESAPAAPQGRSKLPWILGGCGCLTLLLILAGAAAFGFYHYKERMPKRWTITTPTPSPSLAPSVAPINTSPAPASYGTLLQFNGGELYRTATVTEAEATKLGNFLVQTGFFDGARRSIQLNKTGTTYEFRMIILPGGTDDPAAIETARQYAARLSREVFDGNPVVLHLCDPDFRTLRVVEMAPSSTSAAQPEGLLADELNTFVSTMENVPEDYRPHFVPFRLRYPSSFRIEKRENTTFVSLYRYTGTGSNMGSFEVTWFRADEGTRAEIKRDLDKISKQWGAPSQFKYKELKRYRETVGGVEGDAVLFQYTMPDREGGFVAGGKSIILRRPGGTRGVIISVYNTWEDPKIKKAADVGVTDDLAIILRSFEFL